MKSKTWREKIGYNIGMIVYAAIVLGFVVCALGNAATEKWEQSTPQPYNGLGTVPIPSIGNFSLRSILEVPMELLDLQNIKDAEDRIDRGA